MELSPSRVRAARVAAEMSQREVSVAADVSIDTVRRAENGLHEPGANAIGRIARALGVSIDSLFIDKDATDTPEGREETTRATTTASRR